MPYSSAGRIAPVTHRTDAFRESASFAPGGERQWLQPDLLGQPACEALALKRLKKETRQASLTMLQTLDLLMPLASQSREQQTLRFAQRMEAVMLQIRQYALGERPDLALLSVESIADALRDFMHFTAMALTASRVQGQLTLAFLPHLVGLALVRYRLESH